jgi:hypothetical protein
MKYGSYFIGPTGIAFWLTVSNRLHKSPSLPLNSRSTGIPRRNKSGNRQAQASPLSLESLVPKCTRDPSAPQGVRRDDSSKLQPYGLTPITRHPLILPMVPWGIANGMLAGARAQDLILFWGIALYSTCGCYAQDLRAQASAAVGTTFDNLPNFIAHHPSCRV